MIADSKQSAGGARRSPMQTTERTGAEQTVTSDDKAEYIRGIAQEYHRLLLIRPESLPPEEQAELDRLKQECLGSIREATGGARKK